MMKLLQDQTGAEKGKDNSFTDTMNDNDSKNPATAKDEVVIPITDLKRRTVGVKSKNPDGEVKYDDVDATKRRAVDDGLEIPNEDEDDLESQDEDRMSKPLTYAAKKTAAQGMIDIALLTSNANQLRNLIEYQRETVTFYFVMVLIVLSLILQITVGIFLIIKGRFKRRSSAKDAASRVCTWIMVCTFLITILNLFIPLFSIPNSTFIPGIVANQTTP